MIIIRLHFPYISDKQSEFGLYQLAFDKKWGSSQMIVNAGHDFVFSSFF